MAATLRHAAKREVSVERLVIDVMQLDLQLPER